MSRRRSPGKRSLESVELNLAAMLDMAFQLLTFFILTFQPEKVEGEIALRLPPARPDVVEPLSSRAAPADPLAHLDSLTISVVADPRGEIGRWRWKSSR
jgi:biopolymer transport protein ExbD